MGRYLNNMVPFERWRQIAGTRFFVDKPLLLEDVINAVEIDGQKFLCITRPRRFGKSVTAFRMVSTRTWKQLTRKSGLMYPVLSGIIF